MTTIRPILEAEKLHACGEPISTYGAFFGLTSGLMTHLRMFNLTVSDKWFPNHRAKILGSIFIGGGFLVGLNMGKFFFHDARLKTLARENHREWRAEMVIPLDK